MDLKQLVAAAIAEGKTPAPIAEGDTPPEKVSPLRAPALGSTVVYSDVSGDVAAIVCVSTPLALTVFTLTGPRVVTGATEGATVGQWRRRV